MSLELRYYSKLHTSQSSITSKRSQSIYQWKKTIYIWSNKFINTPWLKIVLVNRLFINETFNIDYNDCQRNIFPFFVLSICFGTSTIVLSMNGIFFFPVPRNNTFVCYYWRLVVSLPTYLHCSLLVDYLG